jgi:hypothetical protein
MPGRLSVCVPRQMVVAVMMLAIGGVQLCVGSAG